MPRWSDAPAAAVAAGNPPAAKRPSATKKAETKMKATAMPMELVEVVGDDLVVKCDQATTVFIRDDPDQPYCCLDAALMSEETTKRGAAF
eukprot:2461533-Pleurochrysis_carterae.AAC.1